VIIKSVRRAPAASLVRVLSAPLALAVLSAVGLVSALLGDGFWDVLSWCALTLPIAAAAWYLLRKNWHQATHLPEKQGVDRNL
jgi:hypothetical protein